MQSTAASAALAGRRRWPLIAAAAVALVLAIVAGSWMLLRPQPPTATELLALTQLRSDFTQRMAEGRLFDPADASALHAARRMREIHATASETVAAFATLQQAAVERARVELSRRDLIALDETLAGIVAGLPETAELAELTQARAALASELASEGAMRARIGRLKALLDGAPPDGGESVLGLYLEMRPALADDPEFKGLEPRVIGAARVAIEAALSAGDSAGALASASRLAQALPQDPDLARMVARLQSDVASADRKRADQAWRQTLAAGPVDTARLAALLAGLEELARLQQPAADQQQMRQLLATVVRADADALAEKVSSAPWARIDEIVDASGKRVALPAESSTPMLMTLPEGRYRVTLSSAQGSARRQEAVSIERGKLATLSLKFPGYDAEQYLREVGW